MCEAVKEEHGGTIKPCRSRLSSSPLRREEASIMTYYEVSLTSSNTSVHSVESPFKN